MAIALLTGFLLGAILYLSYWKLYDTYGPIPPLVLWFFAVFPLCIGSIGFMCFFAAGFIPASIPACAGAYFFQETTRKEAELTYLNAVATLFPLQLITLAIGAFNPLLPDFDYKHQHYFFLYCGFLILAPNFAAYLLWCVQKRKIFPDIPPKIPSESL